MPLYYALDYDWALLWLSSFSITLYGQELGLAPPGNATRKLGSLILYGNLAATESSARKRKRQRTGINEPIYHWKMGGNEAAF
ncbi:uncharacterized protein N7458_002023 [Penicillium daleae]|uniref:Uncharacterized protein n=1 Tax=Penicillium daleae TaxID=63821 RepID=A0AAD6CC02_9EURO|nr:uncharacterized protein N7458_002023 [Penicillium daleae]KAJ5460471.1 hypothetical protein N7458_002023 [Penicillium daleae]